MNFFFNSNNLSLQPFDYLLKVNHKLNKRLVSKSFQAFLPDIETLNELNALTVTYSAHNKSLDVKWLKADVTPLTEDTSDAQPDLGLSSTYKTDRSYVYLALKLMIINFKIPSYFLIYINMHYKELRFKEEFKIESRILYLKFCFLLRNIFI